MRRRWLLLLLGAINAPLRVIPARAAEPAAGRISRLEGAAEVVRAGASSAVATGTALLRGDVIRTDAGARLSIECPDGLVIVLGASSELRLDDYLQGPPATGLKVALALLDGIMRLIGPATAQPRRIEVETRTAIASVRSTEWLVEANAGGTGVLVLEGRVSVRGRAGGEVLLAAPGQGTDVRPDQLPSVPRAWGGKRRDDALRRTSF